MRLLVACEESGEVRRAFRALGHDAYSCDLIEAADNSPHHIQDDALRVIHREQWDMLIAFPPCTHLCVSAARWFSKKRAQQEEAIEFVRALMLAPIDRIAIENPVEILSTRIRKPDQVLQPWQFGHGETKATCLWLQNLPTLTPTNVVDGREPRVHMMSPGPNRARERSKTYAGIAKAMAEQWGQLTEQQLRLAL